MKRAILIPLITIVASGILAGCATPSRFEWGAYEPSLYAFAKRPDLRAQYRTTLEKAIAEGRRTNRLAPGLLAELGYLCLEDGDSTQATRLFEEEIAAFPESGAFLRAILARTKVVPTKKEGAAS